MSKHEQTVPGRATCLALAGFILNAPFVNCFSTFLFTVSALSVTAQDVSKVAPKFLGVQSCSSSSCHGGAKTGLDQVIVWQRRDYHTRSYATLTTARSARIAEVLKIDEAAQSARCTSCHAPFSNVSTEQRTETVKAIHGVSCENCHGPAEPWLRAHTRLDFTHEDKVATGMRDLRNFYVRANTCVACHQNVEPELLKAGHPELIFELDGQCVTEPRHWRERRENYGPALWLTGQAVALREMSWQLGQQNAPLPKEVERWAALEWLLRKVGLRAGSSPAGSDKPPAFKAAQESADMLAREAAEAKWTKERIRSMLKQLAEVHTEFGDPKFSQSMLARRAERLALALDRLSTALLDDGPAAKTDGELDQLFRAVQSLPDFDPSGFARLLQQFSAKLAGTVAAEAGR